MPAEALRRALRDVEDLASVWRGDELAAAASPTVSSGWRALDSELPGVGWPMASLTEVLSPQPSTVEWRIVGPALRAVAADNRQVVLVGPPKAPHLPGLMHDGITQRHLVWVRTETPAERLWVTEQLIKSNAVGAVLAWVPQARQEQIRRLQIHALSCEGLCFLFRPEAAQHDASAAPLRVHVAHDRWAPRVSIVKRRGSAHAGDLLLPSIPGGLEDVMTPRLEHVGRRDAVAPERLHVVGDIAPRAAATVN